MSKNKTSIVDEVKSNAKALKSKKEPKTVKVSTLLKVAGVIVAMGLMFASGYVYATEQQDSYNSAVKTEAVRLVDELKSSK